MAVSFFSEGIAMPDIRRRDVSAWIRQVAQLHGKRLGEVCYKFVNDEGILDCNRQFLGLRAILLSASTPCAPMPSSSISPMSANSIASSSMASCISVASTTRARVSVRSWSKTRTRRSPCISPTSNNC